MTMTKHWGVALVAILAIGLTTGGELTAQRGRGFGAGRGRGNVDPNLPETPTAVALPAISSAVTGPGAVYESVQSLPPGMGLDHFNYEATEYFVSGTAAKKPYKTRVVVRRPKNNTDFSGFVLAEAMHPSGSAHMFEYDSIYLMDAGHIAVDIGVVGVAQFAEHNAARYGDVMVDGDQVSEVLAQVGALMKQRGSGSPLADVTVRKMILAGTSATAGVLIRYLPAHGVYRTPDMQHIYDGFLPTSTGATIQPVDVPLIQVPTMTEVATGTSTPRQDGDAPGDQFRLYEFAGMSHVDSRDSVRFKPDPCAEPISTYPLQAYMSVALHHLFEWVDNGTVPPRAERMLVDRNVENDGSIMALDEDGNPVGGIRSPYVDVPVASYHAPNRAADTPVANPGAWLAANPGGANLMCRLAGYQKTFTPAELKARYGDTNTYRRRVEARMQELESAGWSLPLYREMILADADRVRF